MDRQIAIYRHRALVYLSGAEEQVSRCLTRQFLHLRQPSFRESFFLFRSCPLDSDCSRSAGLQNARWEGGKIEQVLYSTELLKVAKHGDIHDK